MVSSFPPSLGIRIQDNRLSYFDFLRVIDDRAAFRRRKKHTVPPVPPISYMQLGIDEAMMKVKQVVTASSDLLYKVSTVQLSSSTSQVLV